MIGINGLLDLDGYYFRWCPIYPSHGTLTNPCRIAVEINVSRVRRTQSSSMSVVKTTPRKLQVPSFAKVQHWQRASTVASTQDVTDAQESSAKYAKRMKTQSQNVVKGIITMLSCQKFAAMMNPTHVLVWLVKNAWPVHGVKRWEVAWRPFANATPMMLPMPANFAKKTWPRFRCVAISIDSRRSHQESVQMPFWPRMWWIALTAAAHLVKVSEAASCVRRIRTWWINAALITNMAWIRRQCVNTSHN